ncbi:MAG: CorA family divalent cation transporter, partial [Candidatus Gracilibacteria bacterium]|nr:CorA family divalent cation transporter [Candidatus Gracilibacteria bacterium]
ELDREAVVEENQRARVDTYEDYLFVVMHFPKFDMKNKRYFNNEFNVFISKKFLITIRWYTASSIEKIFESYKNKDKGEINTGYILYDMIDAMLDKSFKLLDKSDRDVREIESSIFGHSRKKETISDIMIKKRNIITLKHMLEPQIPVFKILELRMNTMFKDEVEVYFENLIDKLEKIVSEIVIIQENVESVEDTLKSLFDLQTNNSVRYLTIFSAFMLPLTLITGFFGMNLELGLFNHYAVFGIFTGTTIVMLLIFIWLIKKNKL